MLQKIFSKIHEMRVKKRELALADPTHTSRVLKNCLVCGAHFEGHNSLGSHVFFQGSQMGFGSYIGDSCSIENSKIGRFSSIGSEVKFLSSRHPINELISSSPAFYDSIKRYSFGNATASFNEWIRTPEGFDVVVGSDVWIGTGAFIKGGVTIGDGAIVGMGAVVTKDVGPYEIVVGNPAHLLRKRFDDATIAKLLKISWWNWPIDKILENKELFSNVPLFLERFEIKDGPKNVK